MIQKNEYKWNEHGVCLNPTIAKEYIKDKRMLVGINIRIQIAQKPNGEWCYGFDYSYGVGRSVSGVNLNNKAVFKTADAATMAAADYLLKSFQSGWDTKNCDSIIAKLKIWSQPKQLSLFDL